MSLPRHWRLRQTYYRLEGSQCARCKERWFPPRSICPRCRSRELGPYSFTGRGEVYSYATVYQAPAGFEPFLPYVVALVRLAEGPLVAAQLTDVEPEEVRIGQPVEMVTRKLREYGPEGLIVYGYKFRPLLELGKS